MAGQPDGFLTIINLNLSAIEYSTFIGGDSTDQVNAVFAEDADNIILAGETKSPDFPVTADALYPSINGGMDLVMVILDKTLKHIEYSTYGGGSRQRVMDPVVNCVKGGSMVISSMCISPDFPATLRYAEPDNTWTNCIWEFDLEKH